MASSVHFQSVGMLGLTASMPSYSLKECEVCRPCFRAKVPRLLPRQRLVCAAALDENAAAAINGATTSADGSAKGSSSSSPPLSGTSSGYLGGSEYFKSLQRQGDRNVDSALQSLFQQHATPVFVPKSTGEEAEKLVQEEETTSGAGVLRLRAMQDWVNMATDMAPTNTGPVQEAYTSADDFYAENMAWYAELKQGLRKNGIIFGGLVTAYLYFTVSTELALSYAVGIGAGQIYLEMLVRYIDSLEGKLPDRKSKAKAAEENIFVKGFKAAAVSLSSRRLLVPVAMVVAWRLWNSLLGDATDLHLPLAGLFFGFFSFKAPIYYQTLVENADLAGRGNKSEEEEILDRLYK
eukprot:jgi/Mesvir1/27780/Mv07462-RA.1